MNLPEDLGRRLKLVHDPDGAGAGSIQHKMIQLAAAIVVEGERPISGIHKVIAADPVTRRALCVHRKLHIWPGGQAVETTVGNHSQVSPRLT